MTTRDAYLQKTEARLDELKAELLRYEARARALEADARLELEGKLTDLQQKREDLGDRISQIREAGADSWEALKDGVDHALDELTSGLAKAKERLEPALA